MSNRREVTVHLDRRFAMVVGLSLLWALLVSTVFYRVAAKPRGSGSAGRGVPVVVAVQGLPMGASVTRDSVRLETVPENLRPKGSFSRLEDVLDRPVVSAIEAEEPLVESRLAQRGSGLGLAPLIPRGMRAISVRVNDVVGVAGFILPGMHVDVLVTGRPPGRTDTVTRTVLQNITVLSAGQTIQADAKNPAINTPVVTLLVTPDQAESLTLGNSEGRVQLVLRNSADLDTSRTPGKQLNELYAAAAVLREPAPGPSRTRTEPVRPAPEPAVEEVMEAPPVEMMVIRGSVKTIERFSPNGGRS
jgi:pilus assembly protein CpaB